MLAHNLNNKIDPCTNGSADLHGRVDTIGIAFDRRGRMTGKLQVLGDVSLTLARTDGDFGGGSYVNNPPPVAGAPVGTIAA